MKIKKSKLISLLAVVGSLIFASLFSYANQTKTSSNHDSNINSVSNDSNKLNYQIAVFAGGCFWCTESDFEKKKGVIKAESGYTAGHTKNPTYKQVSYENTGHYEAVKVTYDPTKTNYSELVDFYWSTVDPTDAHGQFCDKGDSYRSAIFYANENEHAIAKKSLANLIKSKPFKENIETKLLPAAEFYLAEDYHQDYYKKNPIRYNFYRHGCGRDKRLKELWGKN